MKRVILLLAVLLALPFCLRATESPTQLVLMGSGWSDNNFSQTMDFGFKTGIQTSLDADKGMWFRATYSRWNLKPQETTHAMSVSTLMDWYVAPKWSFYLQFGGEVYIDGALQGLDMFTGFGVSWRLWTAKEIATIPAHFNLFSEIVFADGSGQFSGDYVQLNLGLRFGRSVK
ncbi:MAG: hypothetical protein KAJ19_10595 [Gammaproteobacteria bacterium]|nr:hypothetical protein [Gammaproteobacteria bacterium]